MSANRVWKPEESFIVSTNIVKVSTHILVVKQIQVLIVIQFLGFH